MSDRSALARLARGSAGYPAGLLDLSEPPDELFTRGAWPSGPWVAIVGSRAATPYGIRVAGRLAGDLGGLGVVIVSGLARGIDAAAHRGALESGRATVAVLPGSLDRITPASHAALAERILERGALVAEWDRDRVPRPGLFLRRNRLIAALARATVVVEAAEQSGALSTARWARSIGRPVLAVPGDVDRGSSRGCLMLLREGAAVCAGAADVVRALGGPAALAEGEPARPQAAPDLEAAGPGVETARLARCLDSEPRTLEALARAGGVAADRALAALLDLEWSGLAVAHPGQRWSSSGAGVG